MPMLMWARNTGLLFAAILLVNLTGVGTAAACKCRPPTVESSYNNNTDVVTVELVKTQTTRTTRTYLARVLRTFKGGLERHLRRTTERAPPPHQRHREWQARRTARVVDRQLRLQPGRVRVD
jgi:hypothetical protein